MTRQPSAPDPRWKTIAGFLFWTALTLGSYPVYVAAKQAPRYNREAVLLRAEYLLGTAPNTSSWPWLRRAWMAWVCELCLVEGIAMLGGAILGTMVLGTLSHALKSTGQMPTSGLVVFYLAAATILAPQGYLLTKLVVLMGHSLWPERLFAHVAQRYREALARAQGRASSPEQE